MATGLAIVESSVALCQATRWARSRIFIDPESATDKQREEAIALCNRCPVLRECARAALQSGTTLDTAFKNPATQVIQAGVVCDGSTDSEKELARRAGIPVEKIARSSVRHKPKVEGAPCRGCGRTLWRWTREPGEIPEGYVMHYARGYCVKCRTLYTRWLKKWRATEQGEQQQLMRAVIRKDYPLR